MKRKCFFRNPFGLLFKHWRHAGYAIFSTLHHQVRIGVLGLSYFATLGVYSTFAQTDTDTIQTKIKLNEVEVSVRRAPSLFSEVGRTVTVLSRGRIENLPVQSVQALLRQLPGIDVRERGPLGAQADVSIRGGSFDQVMILLNGINITDPQTGHLSLNLPVEMDNIDRVEVIQGSASRVYGPNAFNGAINFITGLRTSDNVRASVMAGSYGLYAVNAGLSLETGAVRHTFSVGKKGTDGYIDNTDLAAQNLFYHGTLKSGNESVSLQLGYSEKAFGANAFYSATYPNQFEANRTMFGALSMESGTRIKMRPKVYWRRHHDRFELFRDYEGAADWYTGHNYHMTDVTGASVNASIPWSLGVTSLGGEVRSETVWSNVLGYEMDDTLDVPGESEGQFTYTFNRVNTSIFLEHNFTIYKLNVSAGVLANHNSSTGYGVEWFPGVDVSYWFNDRLKWIAAYNESLRLPTFTDLFYDGPTNVGNASLKPEKASTIETGLRYRHTGIDVYTGGFYRKGTDLIDWGRQENETVYTTSNINEVKTFGLESSFALDIQQLWIQNWVRNLTVSYNRLWQEKEVPEGYQSVYVLNHLKHKLNVGLEHGLGVKDVTARWNVLYRDRAGSYTVSATGLQKSYEPVWLTDVRITWRRSFVSFYGEVTNLMDVSYADLGELEQPGRWFRAGLKLDMNL